MSCLLLLINIYQNHEMMKVIISGSNDKNKQIDNKITNKIVQIMDPRNRQ